jgi:hypothetical protein
MDMLSISRENLSLIVTVVGTVIVPAIAWFATYTTGRLKNIEIQIDSLKDAKAVMVTREEFNKRMDSLTNLILSTSSRFNGNGNINKG